MNSFDRSRPSFPNRGIHLLLAEVVKFRKQLTVRPELKLKSGWDDAMNFYMVAELDKLRDSLENITYKPDTKSLDELKSDAADTTKSLADDYNASSLSVDNVLMPPAISRDVVWKLDGTDPELPQVNPDNCPNDVLRAFVMGLDNFFVELTRLDSANQPQSITKYESVMMIALLNELYTLTQRKGGEKNRSNIPAGVLPNEEPTTFRGSGPSPSR